MPWTAQRYPVAMRNLAEPTRIKAIAIANALLDEGMDDGRAIRIAIAKAKEWAGRQKDEWPYTRGATIGERHG